MLSFRRPPPILRKAHGHSALRIQRVRQFHASPRRNDLGEQIFSVPHGFLVALHGTGLTWAAVIPIAAISIRLALLAFCSAPARRERAKIVEIMPLVSAKALQVREETERDIQENPHLLAKKSLKALYKKKMENVAADLYKKHGVNKNLTFLPLMQIPVFVVMAETLRRMMGMDTSFFFQTSTPEDGESNLLSTATSDPNALSDSSNWYEPTMTFEGPFAIMDLTAADPTLILPLAVSGIMLANLRYSQHMRLRKGLPRSKASLRLHNGLMGLSILIFPATLHLPSGFLYYWACTSASSLGADIIMDKMFPPRPLVKPCRRPLPSISKMKPKTTM